MILTIEAAPELMEAITREAERAGMTPQEYALKAVAEKTGSNGSSDHVQPETMPSVAADEETRLAPLRADAKARMGRLVDLFAKWDKEDATDDPEELARRQREGDELQANLRANRINIPQDPKLIALLEAMDG